MRFTTPFLLCAFLVAPTVSADMEVFSADPEFPDAPKDENGEVPQRWIGQVALGFAANTGNTENTNLNGRILLGYQTGDWRHTVNLVGYRASDTGVTTAERYVFTGKSDFQLNEHDYLFATAQYENDRFAGFDRRTSQAIGYGRHIFATEKHRLDGEIGFGARQVSFTDGTSENDAIIRLAGTWNWTISESTEFNQTVVVESGKENTYSESVSALKTNLIGTIYSSLSYTVKHNGTVQAGLEKTDTFTSIQLEYRF